MSLKLEQNQSKKRTTQNNNNKNRSEVRAFVTVTQVKAIRSSSTQPGTHSFGSYLFRLNPIISLSSAHPSVSCESVRKGWRCKQNQQRSEKLGERAGSCSPSQGSGQRG